MQAAHRLALDGVDVWCVSDHRAPARAACVWPLAMAASRLAPDTALLSARRSSSASADAPALMRLLQSCLGQLPLSPPLHSTSLRAVQRLAGPAHGPATCPQ